MRLTRNWQAEFQEMGKFTLESNWLRISDPCYEPKGKPTMGVFVVPALPGKWHLTGVVLTSGMYGPTVATLTAYHESLEHHPRDRGERIGKVMVDSGKVGLFDDSKYPRAEDQFDYENKEGFYRRACGLTWSESEDESKPGGCLEFGGLTSSGIGDGMYKTWARTDGTGLAVSVHIQFISEEDEEEEYDDDDYDEDDEDEESDDDDEEDEPDDD